MADETQTARAISAGGMATATDRQPHYNGKQSTRQAIAIVGPMIDTACRLGLYGLACDLALLCHSRAFSNEGATDG